MEEEVQSTQPLPPRFKRALRFVITQILTVRAFLLFLAAVLTLAVSYYFAIALPAAAEARLEFERQKYVDAKIESDVRERREAVEALRKRSKVLKCQIEADEAYRSYVKLNGTQDPKDKDVWIASEATWAAARRQKQDANAECMARQ